MTCTFNLYIYVYARTSLFFVFTLLSSKHVKVLLRLWFVCITLVEPNSNTWGANSIFFFVFVCEAKNKEKQNNPKSRGFWTCFSLSLSWIVVSALLLWDESSNPHLRCHSLPLCINNIVASTCMCSVSAKSAPVFSLAFDAECNWQAQYFFSGVASSFRLARSFLTFFLNLCLPLFNLSAHCAVSPTPPPLSLMAIQKQARKEAIHAPKHFLCKLHHSKSSVLVFSLPCR